MASPIAVTIEMLQSLDGGQLQDLLNRLLHAEARRAAIPLNSVHGTARTRITVPDGGEDARIEWEGSPERTDWLPRRQTMLQSKATDMGPQKCHDEVLQSDGTTLQPQVKAVLEAGGAYVIACTRPAEGQAYTERVQKIRDGLRDGGYADHTSAPVDFYDSNKLAAWTNEFPAIALWIREQLGQPFWQGMQSWDSWRGNPDVQGSFSVDGEVERRVRDLRIALDQPTGTIRLTGLPGLGKTRLAFEASRAVEGDDGSRALSASVLYIKAAGRPGQIVERAEALRDARLPVVLVVDDCPETLRRDLEHIADHAGGRLKLLTIDYEPDRSVRDSNALKVTRSSDDVIREIIAARCPGLPANDLERVIQLAQGYPQMGVLIGQARLRGDPEASALQQDDLLDRLMFGAQPTDPQKREAITICALFRALGIEGDVADQLNWAAHLANRSPDQLYEDLLSFEPRGVVERHGRYLQVQPPPLALRLAANWWKRQRRERLRELFLGQMPPGLAASLCDQMRMLDELDEAREIVAELCGAGGPFGDAEALNTEHGSRCFRSLAEVNPQAAATTLYREFGGLTAEQLREVGPGRRNLVWALEKLSFRRETFAKAAFVLGKFAAAENESWGNNATGQFQQLFQLYLSGTEASPQERFDLLDEFVKMDDAHRAVAIGALGHALETSHFSRTGGAEQQGSGPELKDWRPQSASDARGFFHAAFERLLAIASSSKPDAPQAKAILAEHLFDLISAGLLEEAERAVSTLGGTAAGWPDAIPSIGRALFVGDNLSKDQRARIEELRRAAAPSDYGERVLLAATTHAGFRFVEGDDDDFGQTRLATELERLAIEGIKNPGALQQLLPRLSRGPNANTYIFGRALGRLATGDLFLPEAVAALVDVPAGERDPSLVAGYLAGFAERDSTAAQDWVLKLSSESPTNSLAVIWVLTRTIREKDVSMLLNLLRSGQLDLGEFRRFGYGGVLRELQPASVLALLRGVSAQSVEGKWISVDLAMMYAHADRSKFTEVQDFLAETICNGGMLSDADNNNTMDLHHYAEAATKLLDTPRAADAAQGFTLEILSAMDRRRFPYGLATATEPLLQRIITERFDQVWPVLGEKILASHGVTRLHLQTLLEGRSGRRDDSSKIISHAPLERLMQWTRQHSPEAPTFLARISPLLSDEQWHPMTAALLSEFGDIPGVLDELQANIHTFGWTGSIADYYQQYLEPLRELETHPSLRVREWASDQVAQLLKGIEAERKRDAEWRLGVD